MNGTGIERMENLIFGFAAGSALLSVIMAMVAALFVSKILGINERKNYVRKVSLITPLIPAFIISLWCLIDWVRLTPQPEDMDGDFGLALIFVGLILNIPLGCLIGYGFGKLVVSHWREE